MYPATEVFKSSALNTKYVLAVPVYIVAVVPAVTVPFVVPVAELAFTVIAVFVGAVLSTSIVFAATSANVFPDSSVAEPVVTSTVCVVVPVFVTTNVYVLLSLLAVNVPFVPLVTTMSSAVKSVTGLLKVNVYVMLFEFDGDVTLDDIWQVNAVASIVIPVETVVAVLLLPALSATLFAGTSNAKAPVLPTPVNVNV